MTELHLLGLAVAVGVVQLGWAAVEARLQQGLGWARGPRDEPRPVAGRAARLERAFANYLETFPLFAASLLAAVMAGEQDALTFWGAVAYVAARAVYPFAYAAGFGGRFYLWATAMIGLLLVMAGLFI